MPPQVDLEAAVLEGAKHTMDTRTQACGHSAAPQADQEGRLSRFSSKTSCVSTTTPFGKFTPLDLSDPLQESTVSYLLENWIIQMASASLIIFTALLICMDTGARAQGHEAHLWQEYAMAFCFAAYVLEFAATVYVKGRQVFFDWWTYMDSLVIVTGLIDYIMKKWQAGKGFELLRLLRICRLLRLGRLARALKLLQRIGWLKEVYILVMMMASCLRTLIWSFILCFFVMTFWSILAVELLNDVVVELADSNPDLWSGCTRCKRAFGSISDANWTFFQTIVAGDSWGLVALPVIEKHSWAAVIFVGALSSIVFGVLNLISAVVIDRFAEKRAKDVSSLASDMEWEEAQEKKHLQKMFEKIDADCSGAVSMEELQRGAAKNREFRNYLRVLDIDDKDLAELFDMIDEDRSGEVDPGEFIEALYRMKHTDPKTATRFVRHIVARMSGNHKVLDERIDHIQDHVLDRLAQVESRLLADIEASSSSHEIQDRLCTHEHNINDAIHKGIEKATAIALEEALNSAISKVSKAVKQVVEASSSRTSMINSHMNQLRHTGSLSGISDCSFGSKLSPARQEFGICMEHDISCFSTSPKKGLESQNCEVLSEAKVVTGFLVPTLGPDAVDMGRRHI